VRGIFDEQCAQYRPQNTSRVSERVVIPEAHDSVIALAQPLIADLIARVVRMLTTINFNNQSALPANEVYNVASDCFLPDKFEAAKLARPKPVPKMQFCSCRIAAQRSGERSLLH
jgi:hypothetical protein